MKTIEDLRIAILNKESELRHERLREHDIGKLWESVRNNINDREKELIKMREAYVTLSNL